MATRLTNLTAEQRSATDPWAEKYAARALSTEPADRQTFEAAAARCYRFAGLEWHGNVIWVDNPLVAALAGPLVSYVLGEFDRRRTANRLRSVAEPNSAVHWAVYSALGSTVHKAVYSAIDPAVHCEVNSVRFGVEMAVDPVQTAIDVAVELAVHAALEPALQDAVYSAVRRTVEPALTSAVEWAVSLAVASVVGGTGDPAIRSAVRSAWRNNLGGARQASWHAYTSFLREVCGLELKGDLWERDIAFGDAALSAGAWWPHKQFIMVSERPSDIRLEQHGTGRRSYRLHGQSAPAIAYPDGWRLFFWHGVRVPEELIEARFTAPDIDQEPNAEIRRCMIEKYGADRYLIDVGAREVQRDDWGVLYRRTLPGDEDLVMVKVLNGTAQPDGSFKDYWLRVPPQVQTAHEAVAWTFGMEERTYRPKVET